MIFVTPSNWLYENVKKSYLNKYEVKVINNGIDLKKFKYIENNYKEKLNITDKFILLGVASNWNEKKGLNTFIKLAEKLDSKYKTKK